jgi:hypothetical protein
MRTCLQTKWIKEREDDEYFEAKEELTPEERRIVMEEFYEITDRCGI